MAVNYTIEKVGGSRSRLWPAKHSLKVAAAAGLMALGMGFAYLVALGGGLPAIGALLFLTALVGVGALVDAARNEAGR